MLGILLFATTFLIFFFITEVVKRRYAIDVEVTRKTVHIACGITCAAMPFFITFNEIAILAAMMTITTIFIRWSGSFTALNGVKRKTLGEIYFPIAVGITALLFPEKSPYVYGMLVMGISDGLAGLLGSRYGGKRYRLVGDAVVTALGCWIFFSCTFVITYVIMLDPAASAPFTIIKAAGISLSLTVMEAVLPRGMDNIVIPIAAACFISAALP